VFFDLDDFFFDPDGDVLTYSVMGNLNVIVTIDAENRVSFSNIPDFVGEEFVTFNATDSFFSATSNVVKLTVEEPPFIVQIVPQQTTSSSSSSRTRIRRKIASIGIIFDSIRKTVEKGEKITVPVKIKNTGEVPLTGINLDLLVDKKDLKARLSISEIGSLGVGSEEILTLTIDTTNVEKSRYTISLTAQSTDIEESAVFIIDILQETGNVIKLGGFCAYTKLTNKNTNKRIIESFLMISPHQISLV